MKRSIVTALAVLCLGLTASAQEAAKTVEDKKVERTVPLTPPEFVIEVKRQDGCVVSPVSGKSNVGYMVYSLPRPAKFQPDSSGNPINSTVFVTARQRDGVWEVKVSIGKGEFYDAGSAPVGEFKLATNERAEVTDVSRFGVSPIRVGVVKIIRTDADKPSYQNFTQSVSVESVDATKLPDPFKLQLKNTSNQDLIAIQSNTFQNGGFVSLKWLSTGLVTPLIKSGTTYTFAVNSEDKSCGDANGYHPEQTTRIDLVSAVYADGTYEGQTGLPVLVKGAALGNRQNLQRVIDAVRDTKDPADLAVLLDSLAEQMKDEADPYLIETLKAMFPAVPDLSPDVLASFIRAGMHDVRVNLTRDAKYLRMIIERNNQKAISAFVERTKTKYERWTAAAEKITSQ